MTTYPPSPLLYQRNMAMAFQDSSIAYVGYEGTIFHLSGPFAPVLGAQSGAAIVNLHGLDAPFRHLDNKGARQDGTTWYDTLYDPLEVSFTVELSGLSAKDIRDVTSSWWGAWDTKQTGKLCWFSPERGEWWCNVRMGKSVQNQYKNDWYHSKRVQFNWVARSDEAFWQSVDSVSTFQNDSNVATDNFMRTDYGSLESNWQQTYVGGGLCATANGASAAWVSGGGANASVINQYVGSGGRSGDDSQFISLQLANDMPLPPVGVIVTVSATGGTFTMSYGGQTTSAIAFNASTATVQSALTSLSNIGSGNATVTGAVGNYSITLSTATPVAGSITANGAALTGGTAVVSSPTSNIAPNFATAGSAWTYQIKNVSSGVYTLSYNGFTTGSIAWNASSAAVQSALAAALSTSTSNISVYSDYSYSGAFGIYTNSYMVQFSSAIVSTGTLTGTNTGLLGVLATIVSPTKTMPSCHLDGFPANPSTYNWYLTYAGVGTNGTWSWLSGSFVYSASAGARGALSIYQTPTSTDSQTVSMTLSGSMNADSGGNGPEITLVARSDAKGLNYVYANIFSDKVEIGCVKNRSGILGPLTTTLDKAAFTYGAGTYALICDGINFTLTYNGSIIAQVVDTSGYSQIGANYRCFGFGSWAPLGGPVTPGPSITALTAADNFGHTFLDVWGRMDTIGSFTITGPGSGTFTLSSSGNTSTAVAWNASAATVQLALQSIGISAVSVTGTGPWTATMTNGFPGSITSVVTISSGSVAYAANLNGIRARFGYNWATLNILANGALTQVWAGSTLTPLRAGDTISLQCGVTDHGRVGRIEQFKTGTAYNPRQFQIFHNGQPLITPQGSTTGFIKNWIAKIENYFGQDYGYKDTANLSKLGVDVAANMSYRGWGFGMSVAGNGLTQIAPSGIDVWSGGSDSGFIQLTNIGDQPGWPRYLCYGPGTFVVGDANTGNTVTFGPLLAGQVALLTSLPRLQGVVDLTPDGAVVTPQQPKGLTSLLANLIDFATNNNVPPLLQQFESNFGVVPPQGPLYSLLYNRFVTPLPAMLEQVGSAGATTQIPVQIRGGSSSSKIVAALTPMRRWPE